MTSLVYNIARLRKIPFFTLDQFFSLRRAKSVFSWAKQACLLFLPSVHNALWVRAGLSRGDQLSQGIQGVLG